jgi:outer membrane protein TolC
MVKGASGVANFTYVTAGDVMGADVIALGEVVDYDHLAVVGGAALVASLPERVRLPTEYGGRRITYVESDGTVAGSVAGVPAEADAIYLMPMVNMTRAQITELLEEFAVRKLPVIAMLGEPDVRAGALLGVAPDDWLRRVSRRVALVAQRILSGEDPAVIPVTMVRESRLYFNARTAQRIGLSPPFELILEAVVVDDLMPPGTERVDLEAVMAKAQERNRDIAATENAVAAGDDQVDVARAELLPQAGVGLDARLIDKDRAKTFPLASEGTFSGSVYLNQIIWSDRAWAGYTIEKHLQEARVGELNRVRLDVGLEAASAYIEVLRAQTFLQIQRQNLVFTRANLDRADVRVAVGDANRSELYRWQSKIAGEQTQLVDVGVYRRQAMFELNRVLYRPLEDPLELVDATIDEQFKVVVDERIDEFIDDPASLDILRDFLARKGLDASPELQQLDAAILAAERAHTAATRSFWAPDVGLTFGLEQVFSRSGEGSTVGRPPELDDTFWNVGLFLSLPILEGGARIAETSRTTQETYRLQREREGTAYRVERAVRSAVYDMAGSRLAVDLQRSAAAAAQENLTLVADNYTQGRAILVELLDAQTNFFNSEMGVADAVNDYLLDLMRVERAVGQFIFFISAEDREAWIQELEQFSRERQ